MLSSANAAAAIIVIAALWVVFAAALAILAAKRIRRAQAVLGATRTMRSLLDAAPARAMIIHADGTVDADARLIQELGLSAIPRRIEDLTGNDSGFEADDLSSLIEGLADVRLGGAPLPSVATGRWRAGSRASRRIGAAAGQARFGPGLAVRHQRCGCGARDADPTPPTDRRRARCADAPHTKCSVPDVVSRT